VLGPGTALYFGVAQPAMKTITIAAIRIFTPQRLVLTTDASNEKANVTDE
jgi:hypothetical protein